MEAAAPQPFNRGGRETAGRAPPPLPLLLKGYRRRLFLAPTASTSLQLWDFGGRARSGSLPKSRWTCDGASSSERCRRWCREAGFCSSSLPAGSRAWRTSARSSDGQPAPRRRKIQRLFPVALAAGASHACSATSSLSIPRPLARAAGEAELGRCVQELIVPHFFPPQCTYSGIGGSATSESLRAPGPRPAAWLRSGNSPAPRKDGGTAESSLLG